MSTNESVDSAEDSLNENDGSGAMLWGHPLNDVIAFVGLILSVKLLYMAQMKIPRTEGRELKYHAIFIAAALVIVLITPLAIRSCFFSPFAVMIVGSVFPIYESIYAVCTVVTEDDKLWLQYWVAQGTLSYSTEWIDDLEPSHFQQHWFEFEFFFVLWLQLPWTDGAQLLHNYVTIPLLEPVLAPVVKRLDGWINKAILTFINGMHLWILWAIFELLPPSFKRMVWIGIGVVFPIASSICAIVTPDTSDDTVWLTYWSAFGTLFLVVDLLENFLGKVPGFYTLSIFITVYLMLPMFHGAEKVFRHILVPLANLQEELIRKDAEVIKNEVMRKVPEKDRVRLMKSIADTFHQESIVEGTNLGGQNSSSGYGAIAIV